MIRYTVQYHMRKIVQNQRIIQIWKDLGRSPVNLLFRTDSLLRALASQLLKTHMDRYCTTSLGNLSNTWLFHAEKVFSWIQAETFLLQFMTVASCPPTMQHCEEPDAIFSITSSWVLAGSYQVPMKSPFLHAEQAPFPQPLFTGQTLQPPDHLGDPLLNSLQFTNVFLMLRYGGHHWTWHCTCSLMTAE